jgi:osmoprotectant transport system permease protein
MMAGLHIAAVIAVGVASIAPYIGGDGLGREIVSGINSRSEIRACKGPIRKKRRNQRKCCLYSPTC